MISPDIEIEGSGFISIINFWCLFMSFLLDKISVLNKIVRSPKVTIDLMEEASRQNNFFYQQITKEFYDSTRRRHSRFPIIRNLEYGVALCQLPKTSDEYWMMVEASVRRNCKKAMRLKYRFERINYNMHLNEIREIQLSTEYRQGKKVPEHWGVISGAKPSQNHRFKTGQIVTRTNYPIHGQ